jgi:hypothetical protein
MNHRDISKLESLYRSVIINEAQDTSDKGPQFDRTNSYGLFMIGSNDGFRRRDFNPRWFPDGPESFRRVLTTGEKVGNKPVTDLTEEEIAEYAAGYRDGEKEPYHAQWDS